MIPGLPSAGMILGLVAALLAAAGGGYWRGYVAADRSAQIERLEGEAARFKQTIAGRDTVINELQAARSRDRQILDAYKFELSKADEELGPLRSWAVDYAAEQAKAPGACAFTPDDVLDVLRGKPRPGADHSPN